MEKKVCAAGDCKKVFIPEFTWQKFCCIRCKTRTHVRRLRTRQRQLRPDPFDPNSPQAAAGMGSDGRDEAEGTRGFFGSRSDNVRVEVLCEAAPPDEPLDEASA